MIITYVGLEPFLLAINFDANIYSNLIYVFRYRCIID